MPQEGPVIVASNHISFGSVVVGCVFDRQINFIAKEELFHIPILKQLLRASRLSR